MKDTLTTIATGAAGAGASLMTESIVTPTNTADIVQIIIGILTVISMIKQTFFNKKKSE